MSYRGAMPRLFLAINVEPGPALVELLDRVRANGRGLRVVRYDPLHLTLAFLGETAEQRVEPIASQVRRAVQDVAPFDMPLRGLDQFGPPDRPRVLLTRPAEDARGYTQLMELANLVRSAVREDLPPDRFGFTPHITLARAHNPSDAARTLQRLLPEYTHTDLGIYRVDTVRLIESELTPSGPTYRERTSAVLRGV